MVYGYIPSSNVHTISMKAPVKFTYEELFQYVDELMGRVRNRIKLDVQGQLTFDYVIAGGSCFRSTIWPITDSNSFSDIDIFVYYRGIGMGRDPLFPHRNNNAFKFFKKIDAFATFDLPRLTAINDKDTYIMQFQKKNGFLPDFYVLGVVNYVLADFGDIKMQLVFCNTVDLDILLDSFDLNVSKYYWHSGIKMVLNRDNYPDKIVIERVRDDEEGYYEMLKSRVDKYQKIDPSRKKVLFGLNTVRNVPYTP